MAHSPGALYFSGMKPCSRCSRNDEPSLVRGEDLCIWCQDADYRAQQAAEADEEQAFQDFLNEPEEDRWRQVWDIIATASATN